MRKAAILIACVLLLAVSVGCQKTADLPEDSGKWGAGETAPPEVTAEQTPEATSASSVSVPPAETATPMPSPAATPSLPPGAPMYSSYAHMVTYDPAVGVADFDYFDLLQGKDAVKWLVEQKGYTQAEAEAEVADYADSEFIEKNTNKQLRTIDLKNIPITLMFDPDTGDMLEVSHPLKGTLIDLYNLYELDHDLVLNSFFYWIEVKNGKVVSLEQVYWP